MDDLYYFTTANYKISNNHLNIHGLICNCCGARVVDKFTDDNLGLDFLFTKEEIGLEETDVFWDEQIKLPDNTFLTIRHLKK